VESARFARRARPLLCELHAHTAWSDGELTLRQLVDLYGGAGFDVLCVTDHALPPDDPYPGRVLEEASFGAYVRAIEREAERARTRYGLLVVPGLELTFNHLDPRLAAHAVAVGLRRWVPLAGGLEHALRSARAAGAALIAAHPDDGVGEPDHRQTCRFHAELGQLGPLVDRFELVNRSRHFVWVGERGLPAVASGDFHQVEHLETWKTLLVCPQDERAVVECLRSGATYLVSPRRYLAAQAA
jgi:hypothetical protein